MLKTLKAIILSIGLIMTISPSVAKSEPVYKNDAVVGPPLDQRYQILTDQIFPTTKHHLSDTLTFPNYYQWKRELSGKHGFDFWILNTPILQFGSTNGKSYLDNELDLFINWRLFETDQTVGRIFFWGLYVQTFTDNPSGAFAASQGLFTFPNGGATDPDQYVVAPSAFWWEQEFKNTGFTYRMGQLYAASNWGTNSYLGDDRATFMNTALSTNQGAAWSSGNRGLGAMATLDQGPFYLSAGFQDAKGNQKTVDVNSFSDGRYAYLGEIGFAPTWANGRTGKYKITVGHVDQTGSATSRDQRSGWGVIASAEQDINDRFAAFGIVRKSWNRIVGNTDLAAGAGVIAKAPFGWVDDQIGVAGFYAKPFDSNGEELREEYGIEAFWRMQLTPRVDFTPDIQLYLQPGRTNQDRPVAVFGLRLRSVL
jgi:porin